MWVKGQKTYSIQDVCEYVSHWLCVKHRVVVSPRQIYLLSPSGELFPVFDLFYRAQREMGDADCVCDNDGRPGDICIKCRKLWTGVHWHPLEVSK